MKRLILLLSFAFCWQFLWAQQSRNYDLIYLNSGSILKGKIVSYYPDQQLKLKLMSGNKIKIPTTQIDSIVQTEALQPKVRLAKAPVEFKSNGWYSSTHLSFMNGSTPWYDDYTLGLGFSTSVGYFLQERLGLGLGSGIDYYYVENREIVVPVFVEARQYFRFKSSVQSYLSFSGGYSIGIKNEDKGVLEAKGGWMVHPAAGLRFGSSKDYAWHLDVGLRLQEATFTFTDTWRAESKITHEMLYKRAVIRIGLMF